VNGRSHDRACSGRAAMWARHPDEPVHRIVGLQPGLAQLAPIDTLDRAPARSAYAPSSFLLSLPVRIGDDAILAGGGRHCVSARTSYRQAGARGGP
jgi:hypothetical protein